MFSAIVFNITCKSLSYVCEKLITFVSNILFICMCHTIFYNDCNFFVGILVFDRIVFHVFLMSFLKRLKHNSKYICLAARILFFKIPSYVLRLMLIVSYFTEFGSVNFNRLYKLSLYLMDFNKPCVIREYFLCLY